MAIVPTRIQKIRNLHARDVGECNICGEIVAVEFWDFHMEEKHGGNND